MPLSPQSMTHVELKTKLDKLQEAIENTQRSLQFTNIPVYVLVNYIKQETGIDVKQIKE